MSNIHLSIRPEFIDEDHDQAVIHVQTTKCFYKVAIRRHEVTVVAPGLQEEVELSDDQLQLSYEGIAAIAVLMMEER